MALIPDTSVFENKSYFRYWLMRVFVGAARDMQFFVINAQVYLIVYAQTNDERQALFVAGMVGLVQFLPVLLFSLIGGQAADRFGQRKILVICQGTRAVMSLVLLTSVFMTPFYALVTIFSCAVGLGIMASFSPAASGALYPRLVKREHLPLAVSWNSLGWQTSAVLGPAIGGLIYASSTAAVFALASVLYFAGTIAIASVAKPDKDREPPGEAGLQMIKQGLRYFKANKIVQGAISLDLVVVMLGSVTTLLPFFAIHVLDVGKSGLGFLQSALAIGAVGAGYVIASSPLKRNIGRWMFGAVFVFGLSILVFAVSKVFWLSMLALIVAGAADMVSVFIRSSLIQLSTPDEMKGRISSISSLFISASNRLGDFESGLAARLLGPIGASIFGGFAAIGAAGLWWKIYPELARVDTFEGIEEIKVDSI